MGDEADRINDVSPDPSTTISIDFDPPTRRRRAPGEAAGTRKEHDTYDTPSELALACVEWVRDRGLIRGYTPFDHPKILEPTAGSGPFVKAARQTWPQAVIAAVDIRPECQKPCEDAGATIFACLDSLKLDPATIRSADLILTNPPFKLADELARHFWAHMKPSAVLAFMLNITFLGSEGRWDPGGLYDLAPLTYMIPIVPRPSFLTIDGKNTSPKFEAALFVWVKGGGVEEKGWAPQGARIPTQPIRWEKSK